MDERIRFVARLLEGEKMAPLCTEFGISRKTDYNLFNRYRDCGVAAFTDRSRRPYRRRVDSAQQIIAEVGATAATFPSPKHLASWMGACPGTEESAGTNDSQGCPKGNRQMRRVLNQAANAAVKAKGTIFAIVYRRLVPRLGHAQAIGAIAHRL